MTRLALFGIVSVAGLVTGIAWISGRSSAEPPREATQRPPESARTVSVLHDYLTWTRVNPDPVYIPPAQYAYCAQAPPPGSYTTSPHLGGYITVYVNPVGAASMLSDGNPPFPVGSVIVKEKRPRKDDPKPYLMTAMRKRPPGFDPKHGDWEYSTHDPDRKPLIGSEVDHCRICHDRVKDRDFVFHDYLKGGSRTILPQF